MTADEILTVHPIEIFYAKEQQKSRQESSVVSRPVLRPVTDRSILSTLIRGARRRNLLVESQVGLDCHTSERRQDSFPEVA